MSNLAPVMPGAVDYYDTRRPSVLEQIAESENGSQSPSSTASERLMEHKTPQGSAKDLDKNGEVSVQIEQSLKPTHLKRNRYSASDICEESERLLLARASLPSTRSLKFNINT